MADLPPAESIPPASEPKPEAKKKPTFITLWFDENGELKLKAENLDIYGIVGVLRAATLKFDNTLAGLAPSGPAKKEPGA